MKIKKTVLQAVAIGTFVGIVAASCTKVNDEMPVNSSLEKMHLKTNLYY